MARLHFRFFFFQKLYIAAVSLTWGKLQKLGCQCLHYQLLVWFMLMVVVFFCLFVLLENQNICEFSHLDGRNVSSQLFVPSEGGSCNSQLSPLPILPPSSGSGRIPPSRICNQHYRNAPNDTNTDKAVSVSMSNSIQLELIHSLTFKGTKIETSAYSAARLRSFS